MRAAFTMAILIALAAHGAGDGARAAGRDDGNVPQDVGRPIDRFGRGAPDDAADAPATPRSYYPAYWANSPFQLRRADPYKRYRPRLLELR